MTLRALGTPCIKTTLGQLLAETLFDGAMFDMPSHNLLSKNCKSMLLSDGITQEQVCVILEWLLDAEVNDSKSTTFRDAIIYVDLPGALFLRQSEL